VRRDRRALTRAGAGWRSDSALRAAISRARPLVIANPVANGPSIGAMVEGTSRQEERCDDAGMGGLSTTEARLSALYSSSPTDPASGPSQEHIDARNLPNGSVLEADLCIVGPARAGISMPWSDWLSRAGPPAGRRRSRIRAGDADSTAARSSVCRTTPAGRAAALLRRTTGHWAGLLSALWEPIDLTNDQVGSRGEQTPVQCPSVSARNAAARPMQGVVRQTDRSRRVAGLARRLVFETAPSSRRRARRANPLQGHADAQPRRPHDAQVGFQHAAVFREVELECARRDVAG